mgnify:CR=1 FL=1
MYNYKVSKPTMTLKFTDEQQAEIQQNYTLKVTYLEENETVEELFNFTVTPKKRPDPVDPSQKGTDMTEILVIAGIGLVLVLILVCALGFLCKKVI